MNFSDELWRVCGNNPFGLKKYARETREARRMGLPFSVPKAVVVPLLRYVRLPGIGPSYEREKPNF